MPKRLLKSACAALLAVLLGLGMEAAGTRLNRVAMKANGGRMPALVITQGDRDFMAIDYDYVPLTRQSRLIPLCDWVVVPAVDWFEEVRKDTMSPGDALFRLGQAYILTAPFLALGLLALGRANRQY